MHSTDIDDYTFSHNGDYSGDVTIWHKNGIVCEISVDTLANFIGQAMLSRTVEVLENMDGVDYLTHLAGIGRQ